MTEADLDLYDAYKHVADEIFITSTSLFACALAKRVGERGARGAGGSGVGADYQETRGCLYPLC